MQRPVCLADFEVHFNNSLDKSTRDYYSSGANQQQTLRDNVEAFMRYMYTYNTVIRICTCDYSKKKTSLQFHS